MEPTEKPLANPLETGSNPVENSTSNFGRDLPSIAQILSKRAQGIKLSKAEAGRLSWLNRQSRRASVPDPQIPATGNLPLEKGLAMAGLETLPPAPPMDANLCRDTATELINTLDESAQAYIRDLSKQAKATEETIKLYVERVTLKTSHRIALVNTSPRWLPKVTRIVGLNPENTMDGVALVALVLWTASIVMTVTTLKKLVSIQEQTPQRDDGKA